VIEADKVPFAPGLSGKGEPKLVARLLTAGEDFEILAGVPANKCAAFEARARGAGVTVTEIGQLVEGHNQTTVLFEGQPLGLSRRAFVHGVEEKR
jgi:thiamine-monophosphate kinase